MGSELIDALSAKPQPMHRQLLSLFLMGLEWIEMAHGFDVTPTMLKRRRQRQVTELLKLGYLPLPIVAYVSMVVAPTSRVLVCGVGRFGSWRRHLHGGVMRIGPGSRRHGASLGGHFLDRDKLDFEDQG